MEDETAPQPPRRTGDGWTGRRVAVALVVVLGSLILSLLVAWGAMTTVFDRRPIDACDPFDCVLFDVPEVIATGVITGVITLASSLFFGLRRFVG